MIQCNYCLLLLILCINGYSLSINFKFYLHINATYLFNNITLSYTFEILPSQTNPFQILPFKQFPFLNVTRVTKENKIHQYQLV